jgi:thymus-specific serine protease
VDQALADLAFFIRDVVKSQKKFADSKIILYGGSYAANMVLWFKQRYPHLVLGTVASSAPILAKVDYTGKNIFIFIEVSFRVLQMQY